MNEEPVVLTVSVPGWLATRLQDAAIYGGSDGALAVEDVIQMALVFFLGNADPGKTREERSERNRKIQMWREHVQRMLRDE